MEKTVSEKVNFSIFQDGYTIHRNGKFRALSTAMDAREGGYNILVQEAVNHSGVSGWVDRCGYNSLSNDYAYSNAREDVDRMAKRSTGEA